MDPDAVWDGEWGGPGIDVRNGVHLLQGEGVVSRVSSEYISVFMSVSCIAFYVHLPTFVVNKHLHSP